MSHSYPLLFSRTFFPRVLTNDAVRSLLANYLGMIMFYFMLRTCDRFGTTCRPVSILVVYAVRKRRCLSRSVFVVMDANVDDACLERNDLSMCRYPIPTRLMRCSRRSIRPTCMTEASVTFSYLIVAHLCKDQDSGMLPGKLLHISREADTLSPYISQQRLSLREHANLGLRRWVSHQRSTYHMFGDEGSQAVAAC
jgi:hypothetical protein